MDAMTKYATLMAVVLTLVAAAAVAATDDAFDKAERAWREGRVKRLTSPVGWLTVVGLDWLQPGENVVGSDASCAVRLPAGKAPARVGVLVLDAGVVRLKPVAGSGLMIGGKPAAEQVLGDDMSETTDVVTLGDLSFFVIKRGDRYGVRVKDTASQARANFKGLDYFPADPKWQVSAKFVPYDAPRKVQIATVLGTTEIMEAPGLVTFSVDGKELSLEPVIEDPKNPSLWFIFKDATSAKETYQAGRFLYADMPKDGKVVVDFNQAYNPPCAFTPYATCPLPPKKNWLPIRVEAGEKAFAGATHEGR